jgi:ATP-dependent RNA helicase DOB1
MSQILNSLDYIDTDTLKLKGKVSCCIEAADELITTELLFSKAFNQINAKSIAALCSSLVLSEEKAEATSNSLNDPEIEAAYQLLKEAAEKVASAKQSIQPQFEYDAYMASLKTDLMVVTYKWCEGCSFNEICKHTEIYEGVIIKCFKRIAELLDQLIEASKIIGNNEYVSKFEEALRLLKRDIAFANSLYL